jgi:LytR cell envelope-related transcriptional attenuator
VLGLAVLSALYFSQARDVKRLREWAGRAPERAEQQVVPGRVVAQPQQKAAPAVPGAAAAASGARPAAATAAGARPGAGPSVPVRPCQVPAGATAQAGTQAPPRPGVPVPAGGNAATQGARPGATAAGQRPASAPPVPAGGPRIPGRPGGGPPRPLSEQTQIVPPPREEPWYRRLIGSPIYLVLTIAGVLILGGAAAFGVVELTKDEGTEPPAGERQAASANADDDSGDRQDGSGKRKGGAIKPASVTVAVLNGTTVPGLAATLSDEVGAAGFTVGTITNFTDQQLAESVVQYAPGHKREAIAVSRKLKIPQREPANPSSQELAGDATVIVIAGADKAP